MTKHITWTNPNNGQALMVKVLSKTELFGHTPEKGRIFVQKTTAHGINGIFSVNVTDLKIIEEENNK